MKKNILAVVVILGLLYAPVLAQARVNIIPGLGTGPVTVGQSSSEVIRAMGTPLERTSFAEQKSRYKKFGSDIGTILEFNLGFDSCFQYSKSKNSSQYPVFKIFFKNDRVVSITYSAFVYEKNFALNASIDSKMSFFATKAEMEAAMGRDHFLHSDDFGYDIYEYLEKGVTFMIKKGQVMVVKIYRPFTYDQSRRYVADFKSQAAPVQTENKINIVPGRGTGPVRVGQTSSEVKRIMGPPQERTSLAEQKGRYKKFGRNPDASMEFNLEFDFCFQYSKSKNRSQYPVFKIFFKNDRVVSITYSAFVYEKETALNASIDSKFSFYATRADMEAAMGKNYFLHSDKFGYDIYEYLGKGITFMIKKKKVMVVKTYRPLTPGQSRQYIANFGSPKAPAQNRNKVVIVPGIGTAPVKVGQSSSEVKRIMGPPLERTSFAEQKKRYQKFGRNPYATMEFSLEFDFCFQYSKSKNSSQYPIFKIFFKNDRVVSITYSAFVYEEKTVLNTSIDSKLSFFATRADMEASMGKDYFLHSDKFGYDIYEYLQKGVTFMIKKKKVMVVKTYKPLTGSQSFKYVADFPN